MKFFNLAAMAGAVMLIGCASTNQNSDSRTTKAEENYVPIGTLIGRKSPNAADGTTVVDKQALENDRTMGSAK